VILKWHFGTRNLFLERFRIREFCVSENTKNSERKGTGSDRRGAGVEVAAGRVDGERGGAADRPPEGVAAHDGGTDVDIDKRASAARSGEPAGQRPRHGAAAVDGGAGPEAPPPEEPLGVDRFHRSRRETLHSDCYPDIISCLRVSVSLGAGARKRRAGGGRWGDGAI